MSQWSRLDDYRTVSPPRLNHSRSRGSGPLHSANASTAVYSATYRHDTSSSSQLRDRYDSPTESRGGLRPPMDFGVHHAPSGGGAMTLHNNNSNQHPYSSHNSSYIYEGAHPRPPTALQLQQLPQYLQATTTNELDVYHHHQPSPPPANGSPLSIHHHYWGGGVDGSRGGGGAMSSSNMGQQYAPPQSPLSVHHHYQPPPMTTVVNTADYNQSLNQSYQSEASPRNGAAGGVTVHHHYSPPVVSQAQQSASNYYRSSVRNSGYMAGGGGMNGSTASRDAFLPPHIVQGRQNTNALVMRSLGLMQGELLSAHVRAALLRVEDDEREFRQCLWSDYDRTRAALFDRSNALHRRAIDEAVSYREEQLVLEDRRRLLLENEERTRQYEERKRQEDERMRLQYEERKRQDDERKRRHAQDLLAEHDRRVRRGEAVRQQVIGDIESDRSQVVFERKVHQIEVNTTGGHRGVVEVPYEFEMYQSFVKESDDEALARRQRNEARKQQALEAAQAAAAAKVRAQTMGGRNPDLRQDATILSRSATSPTQRRQGGGRQGHLDYRPSPTRSRDGGRSSPGGISNTSTSSRLKPSRQYLPSLSATSPIPYNQSPGMRSNSSEMSAARRRRSAERSDVRVATPPRGSSPFFDRSVPSSSRKSVRFYENSLSEAHVGGGRVSPVRSSSSRLPSMYHQPPPPLQLLNGQFEGTHKSPDERRAKSAFMTSVLSL